MGEDELGKERGIESGRKGWGVGGGEYRIAYRY